MPETSVRMWTPERSSSPEANPRRIAESWLPLERTTCAPASTSRSRRLREQGHGVRGREGAVVDVAADEDGVDALGADHLDEVVEVRRLGPEEPDTVERAPQVPVGGVEEPHGTHARRGDRQTR